ncbi:Fic family protein [Nanoarchaeota archaeon]
MFLEKRKAGNKIKYYLVHSYRHNKKVKKIRRYLGSNLSEQNLTKLKKQAEEHIKQQIEELRTEIFNFSLSKKEIKKLNNYKITIHHLDKKEWERFTEDFVFNTNAIEGSTVLKQEVHEILQKKKAAEPEEIETQGVAKAVNYIKKTKQDLSLPLILKLHKLCFQGSKDFAGKFRESEVVIRNRQGEIIHRGVPVKELQALLQDYISWYKKNKKKFRPMALAAIIHNQFEHIHPFQDGNGRVGRLLLNFILIKNNYPPINILLEDRQEYYRTLQEYSRHQNMKPTMEFLIKQYKKTLKVTTNKK